MRDAKWLPVSGVTHVPVTKKKNPPRLMPKHDHSDVIAHTSLPSGAEEVTR